MDIQQERIDRMSIQQVMIDSRMKSVAEVVDKNEMNSQMEQIGDAFVIDGGNSQ